MGIEKLIAKVSMGTYICGVLIFVGYLYSWGTYIRWVLTYAPENTA